MVRMLISAFCVLALGAIAASACSSNYHFDYFLLATQWPESFCETAKCNAHQDRWAIHGAWPENNDGSWPQNCCTKQPFNRDVLKPIEKDLIASWSSLKVGGTNEIFWEHEWIRHGTCAQVESPLKDELSYFKSTLEAFHKLHIDQWLAAAKIVPSESHTYPLTAIHAAIKKGLNHTVQIQCIHSKHHRFPVISQINVCLDKKTLQPFDCPLHDRGCKQTSIGYLPSH